MNTESLDDLILMNHLILEAKFKVNTSIERSFANIAVADLSNRIVDKIISIFREKGDNAAVTGWEEWRRFGSRFLEQAVIHDRLPEVAERVGGLSEVELLDLIDVFVAPFDATDEERRALQFALHRLIMKQKADSP